ncbi:MULTISPECIES: TetR/AcrR family transcriptional regulator [Bacillaceae]|uniref:TetR/AcrR family transcriptional regulator n=1 Tax=Bacillaceae TaxID=186817 RepID=UPI00101C7569|nr:TetR/AcrR family transcriptional regulator [Ectobacillus funiculus]
MSSKNLIESALMQMNLKEKRTDKQQRIVEAAIKIFAEKGYTATSTNEIAKAAEVAEGTIFRHFGTKENLLLSVIVPFLMEAAPIVADEFIKGVVSKPYDSFESFLTAIIKNRFAFLEEHIDIFKILVAELLNREDLRQYLMKMFEQKALPVFGAVLDTYKQRGELLDLPNATLLRMLGTCIFGYCISRFAFFPNSKWDDEAEVENLVRLILQGIGESK